MLSGVFKSTKADDRSSSNTSGDTKYSHDHLQDRGAAQDECTPVPEGQSVRQVDHQEGEAHGDVRRERLLYSHGHSILQVLIISVVQACRLARWEAKLELNRNQIANSRAFWHQQMSHLIQFLCFYGFYPLIQPFRGFFL